MRRDGDGRGREIEARVPGHVLRDLWLSGRAPSPYEGMNLLRSRWVGDVAWRYVREFHLKETIGRRHFLLLHGTDYESETWLNRTYLGRHVGMFSPQVYDVTGIIQEGDNALEVLLHPLTPYRVREHWPRIQAFYGWDFAPRVWTAGIWDTVELASTGPVRIEDFWIRSDAQTWRVSAVLDSAVQGVFTLQLAGRGERGAWREAFRLCLSPGRVVWRQGIPARGKLWQTWDLGALENGKVTAAILDGEEVSDSIEARPAHRAFEARGGCFFLNGEPFFMRGTNWVPADLFFGALKAEDYRRHLEVMRSCGINVARVWGGGLREKRAFYDLCDEMGIAVWQEFPLACLFARQAPKDVRSLLLLGREARSIVRALRRHPCVVMMTGGNELSPRRNRAAVAVMRRVVEREWPGLLFRDASPIEGESHNYSVWHGWAPLRSLARLKAPLLSEYGTQSLPDEGVWWAISPGERSLPRPSWRYLLYDILGFYVNEFLCRVPAWLPATRRARPLVYHNAQLFKHAFYLRAFFPDPSAVSLGRAIAASQLLQALVLKYGIENQRLRLPRSAGVLFWQWNDPWPCVSWSVLPFAGPPKRALQELRRILQPRLVGVVFDRYPSPTQVQIDGTLVVVNDARDSLVNAEVDLAVRGAGRAEMWHVRVGAVAPFGRKEVGRIRVRRPRGERLSLILTLREGGRELGRNVYRLPFPETPLGLPFADRLFAFLERVLLH